MKKKSSVITTMLIVVMMITGLCLTLYPSFSNWWNSRMQSRAIANYDRAVANLSNNEKEDIDTVYPHNVKVPSDAVMVDDMSVYAVIISTVLILLLLYWMISGRVGRHRHFTDESVYKIPLRNENDRK